MSEDTCRDYAQLIFEEADKNLDTAILKANHRAAMRLITGNNMFEVLEVHSKVIRHLVFLARQHPKVLA